MRLFFLIIRLWSQGEHSTCGLGRQRQVRHHRTPRPWGTHPVRACVLLRAPSAGVLEAPINEHTEQPAMGLGDGQTAEVLHPGPLPKGIDL